MKKFDIHSPEWKNLIQQGAAELDISIGEKQIRQFAFHAEELLRWNRKINLTTITKPKEIAVKHFLDSILPVPWIAPNTRLLDIGSGGGFPGIPLKIIQPSISVMLIDASRKKVNFQKQVIRNLNLEGIISRHIRAQELVKEPEFRNHFDIVICRAFSVLDAFVQLSLPLVSDHGMIMALKAKISKSEIESAHSKIGKERFSVTLKKYVLPEVNAERSIVIFRRDASRFL